ncbi:MAG: hypothetical protein NZ551_09995 [Microscillaceae bacterium]|nr:hypothetical protein [Microscillaceae bacterium]MDW8461527.1 hypothetical protein [Cytophagales bacterium]
MANNTINPTPIIQNDEINLLQLIAYLIRVVRKNLVVLFILIALGILTSWLYFQLATPLYKVRMIANSNFTDDKEVKAIATQLDEISKEENYDILAQKLQIKRKEAEKIKGFNAYGITGEDYNPNLPDKKDSVFVIEVMISDNQLIETLNQAIPNYIKNLPVIQKKYQMTRQADEKILAQVRQDIAHMDTLKRQINKLLSQNIVNALSMEAGGLYQQSILATEKEALITKRLAFDAINVVEKFAPSAVAINYKANTVYFTIAFLVFFIWIAIAVIREISEALQNIG